ncbi:MAG: hypothetical protein NW224_07515 [Leptolyngbyaceae cyanobacterium bins.302]|nr:hypothetical protein [Leptolyngbyaceae cyanobacterium bins.302]
MDFAPSHPAFHLQPVSTLNGHAQKFRDRGENLGNGFGDLGGFRQPRNA